MALSRIATLVIHAGKRHFSLKGEDLDHFRGERGRRGNKLPRGLQKVDRIEVECAGPDSSTDLEGTDTAGETNTDTSGATPED